MKQKGALDENSALSNSDDAANVWYKDAANVCYQRNVETERVARDSSTTKPAQFNINHSYIFLLYYIYTFLARG